MRSKVTSPLFIIRKQLDKLLNKISRPPIVPNVETMKKVSFPTKANEGWQSLYELVTFRPDISYSDAKRVSNKRDYRVNSIVILTSLAIASTISFKIHKLYCK